MKKWLPWSSASIWWAIFFINYISPQFEISHFSKMPKFALGRQVFLEFAGTNNKND
jgi:hypothetical protein